MKQLWIVGGGGAALEAWAVQQAMEAVDPSIPLAGFVCLEPKASFDTTGLPCMNEGLFFRNMDPADHLVTLALGNPQVRSKTASLYAQRGFAFRTLIHPSAILGPQVQLGEGSIVMALAVLETHVQIGRHALINVHASVAHDGVIGDCCSLGPGVHLAGGVHLGHRCDLGVGACIRPLVHLGPDTVVGAGAAVVKDYPGGEYLVGTPAKPIASRTVHPPR